MATDRDDGAVASQANSARVLGLDRTPATLLLAVSVCGPLFWLGVTLLGVETAWVSQLGRLLSVSGFLGIAAFGVAVLIVAVRTAVAAASGDGARRSPSRVARVGVAIAAVAGAALLFPSARTYFAFYLGAAFDSELALLLGDAVTVLLVFGAIGIGLLLPADNEAT